MGDQRLSFMELIPGLVNGIMFRAKNGRRNFSPFVVATYYQVLILVVGDKLKKGDNEL